MCVKIYFVYLKLGLILRNYIKDVTIHVYIFLFILPTKELGSAKIISRTNLSFKKFNIYKRNL